MKFKNLIKKNIRNVNLIRPKWYDNYIRSKNKFLLDKNENVDDILNIKIKKIISNLDGDFICKYPETQKLYYKLSDFINLNPKNLLLCHGSDGGIKSIFETFLNDNDTICLTNPTFQMYYVYAKIFGTKIKFIEYENKFQQPSLNVEKIIKKISKYKPKVLFLANPDSPTGTIFNFDNLKKIADTCLKNNTIFAIDEAYYPYSNITGVELIKKFNNVIVIRSFAKSWGLAGIRVGYLIGNEKMINYIHKIRPMYEINSLANELVCELIDNFNLIEDSIKRLKTGSEYFLKQMRMRNYITFQGHANFFHIKLNNKIKNKIKKYAYFKENFDHPSLQGYSRFSAAPKVIFKQIINLTFDE